MSTPDTNACVNAWLAHFGNTPPATPNAVLQLLQQPESWPAHVLALADPSIANYLADKQGAWAKRGTFGPNPAGFEALFEVCERIIWFIPHLKQQSEDELKEIFESLCKPLSPELQAKLDASIADECGWTVEELNHWRNTGKKPQR
ncbi:MAG: hypothetical protein WAX89_00340 [Alphaproteobacteria bacterium]